MLKLNYTEAKDGNFFYFASDSHVGKTLKEEGRWESELLDFLEPFIKPDFVIIDGGANIGTHTVFFAKKANEGQIISFEVIPDYYQVLLKNVILNLLSNVTVHNIGLARCFSTIDVPEHLEELYSDEDSNNFGGLSFQVILQIRR